MKTLKSFAAICLLSTVVSAALAAPASAAVITDRGVMCKVDAAGKSTCMQDVTILDDLTLALLAGATDAEAAAMVTWIKSQDVRVHPSIRGYNELTHFVSVLAIGDPAPSGTLNKGPSFDNIPVPELIAGRRADIKAHKKFLLPIAQLLDPVVTQADAANPATALVNFEPSADDERFNVGATTTNVCAKKPGADGFYCIRIDNVSNAMAANKPLHVAKGYFQNVPLARLPGMRSYAERSKAAVDGGRWHRLQGAEKLLYAIEIEVSGPVKSDAPGTSTISAIATTAVVMGTRGVIIGHQLLPMAPAGAVAVAAAR